MVSYNHSSKIILVNDAKYIHVLPSFSTSSNFSYYKYLHKYLYKFSRILVISL